MVFRIEKDDLDSSPNQENTILLLRSKENIELFEIGQSDYKIQKVCSDHIKDHYRRKLSKFDQKVNKNEKMRNFLSTFNDDGRRLPYLDSARIFQDQTTPKNNSTRAVRRIRSSLSAPKTQELEKLTTTASEGAYQAYPLCQEYPICKITSEEIMLFDKDKLKKCEKYLKKLINSEGQTATIIRAKIICTIDKRNLSIFQAFEEKISHELTQPDISQDLIDNPHKYVYISSEIQNIVVEKKGLNYFMRSRQKDVKIGKLKHSDKRKLSNRFFKNHVIPVYRQRDVNLIDQQEVCSFGGFFCQNLNLQVRDWSQCLIYSDDFLYSDFDAIRRIVFAPFDKKDEGLLVELPRVNLQTRQQDDDVITQTPILAVQTQRGHLVDMEKFEREEEVRRVDLAIAQVMKNGDRKVLAQQAIPLNKHYNISPLQIAALTHHNWTWSQVSGIQEIKIESKWYQYVDYAFCELGYAEEKILLVHVFRHLYDKDFSFNQMNQVAVKCLIGRRQDEDKLLSRKQIRIVPTIDQFNQIIGGKIIIGRESFPFLNNTDEYITFREELTESWLKVIRIGAEVDWIQVEADLSRLTLEKVHALTDHQIWKILAEKLCFLLDTVPTDFKALKAYHQFEQIRQFSNYVFLNGLKPYQLQELSPNILNLIIENFRENLEESQKTLIDIVMQAQDPRRELLKKLGLYEDEPVLKINYNFFTIIEAFIVERNLNLVQVFSKRIRTVKNIEKAYEIMMFVLYKVSNDREMLSNFDWFVTQSSEASEKAQNLNICIDFKTKDPYEMQRHQPCQFQMTLNNRSNLRSLVRRDESLTDDVQNDQKSLEIIEQILIDHRVPGIINFKKSLRLEDIDEAKAQISNYDYANLILNSLHSMPNLLEKLKIFTAWIDLNFEEIKIYNQRILCAFIINCILLIYLVLFDVYVESKFYSFLARFISMAFIAAFAFQQYIKCRYTQGKSYIYNQENVFNLLFVILSIAYYVGRIIFGDQIFGGTFQTLADIVMVILAVLKFFFLFRIFEEQRKIFMLIQFCIQDTIPLVIFLLVCVNFFAILSMVMGIDFDDQEYDGLAKYFRLVITFLRSSIGDVNAPTIKFDENDVLKYGSLSDYKKENFVRYHVQLTLMWLQFVIQTFFFNIIVMCIFIALIKNSNEKQMTTSKLMLYQNKSELIVEYYQLRDFMDKMKWSKLETYNTLVMFIKVDDSSKEQIWQGSTNFMRNLINNLHLKIMDKQESLVSMVKQMIQKQTEQVDQKITYHNGLVRKKIEEQNMLVNQTIKQSQQELRTQIEEVKESVAQNNQQVQNTLKIQQEQLDQILRLLQSQMHPQEKEV